MKLYSVLSEYDSVDTLQAVVCDNTSVNTGHKTGAVTLLEKLLDRIAFRKTAGSGSAKK